MSRGWFISPTTALMAPSSSSSSTLPRALDINRLLAPLGVRGSYAEKTEIKLLSKHDIMGGGERGEQGADDTSTSVVRNVRTVVAKEPMPSGEVVGIVPWDSALTGETSHRLLQQVLGTKGHQHLLSHLKKKVSSTSGRAARSVSDYVDDDDGDVVVAGAAATSSSSEVPELGSSTSHVCYSSRDGVALTAALGLMKFLGPTLVKSVMSTPTTTNTSSPAPSPSKPVHWIAMLPPSAPMFGSLLLGEKTRTAVEARWEKERSPKRNTILLEAGSDGSNRAPNQLLSIEEGGTTTATTSPEALLDGVAEEENLLLQDGEDGDDSVATNKEKEDMALTTRTDDVDADELELMEDSMMMMPPLTLIESEITPQSSLSYFKGDAIALTERKQRQFSARHTEESAAMQQLSVMATTLERELLAPICDSLWSSLPSTILANRTKQHQLLLSQKNTKGTLPPPPVSSQEDQKDELLAALTWAHSMLRSRCVNATWLNMDQRHHLPEVPLVLPAIIPLVDLLNHSSAAAASALKDLSQRRAEEEKHRREVLGQGNEDGDAQKMLGEGDAAAGGPNITYRYDVAGRQVLVVTTQPIPAGAPLCLDYNHYRQRLVLFEQDPHAAAADILNYKLKGVSQRDQQSYKALVEMNTLQDLQLTDVYGKSGSNRPSLTSGVRGVVNDDRLNGNKLKQSMDTPMSKIQEASRQAQHGTMIDNPVEIRAQRGEGLTDAEWCFNFGFIKTLEEKEATARGMWRGKLATQVARMTDPFRRGKKGEYVVGVPQGMAALRAQRAMLERHQYDGKTIFPANKRL